jgi:mediator of RNA polymerase II transcription subunit 23
MLDSENYFMPRYLAINEIKLVLSFGKEPYHQRFHTLVTDFVDSFIPTANLISISGRDKLLPIVGFSNLCSMYSFWRFNPSTCKYNTSGPLPYYKHSYKPSQEVFFYLFKQNSPQYILLTLMSLNRTPKQRFAVLEEEFTNTILDAMDWSEQTAAAAGTGNSDFENLRIWNNLFVQFINLNSIVSLNSIINQLSLKLRKRKNNTNNNSNNNSSNATAAAFSFSRDWLMWFLLSTITINYNRNCIPDFIDLFDLLYKDTEPLAVPDCNQFISVIKMAPLSIWVLSNYNPNNSQSSSSNSNDQLSSSSSSNFSRSPPSVPFILRNQLSFMQEMIASQHFGQYGLSICLNAYSIDTYSFSPLLSILLEKIGKSALSSQQQQQLSSASTSTNQYHPLANEMIASFSMHVKIHLTNYILYLLSQKSTRMLTYHIPAAIPETYARLISMDTENFLKNFTTQLWSNLINAHTSQQQPQQPTAAVNPSSSQMSYSAFLHQQMNLIIEIVAFRLKHLNCTHRSQFLFLLNNLYAPAKPENAAYIKHPQIYVNVQCATLKLLSTFTGSDFFELLNAIYSGSKHGPKYYVNPESEEINKAIVYLIARAIQITAFDLLPQYENKEKEDAIKSTLKQIFDTTPIYFHEHVIEHFPKVLQQFIVAEQSKKLSEKINIDSSNKQYKSNLKKLVENDYKLFSECRHEAQVQNIFQQNQNQGVHTILCLVFNLLLQNNDTTTSSSFENFNTYLQFILSNLNGLENKKMSQALRTFCDYLVIESANKPLEVVESYVNLIVKMINTYNLFTYDRFLFIMTFRSFDVNDFQLSLNILYLLFHKNVDFNSKFNSYMSSLFEGEKNGASSGSSGCQNEKDDWNFEFQSKFISMHPDKFFYDGIKESLGISSSATNNDMAISSNYGNFVLRCLPVLDYLNCRCLEIRRTSKETDQLLDLLNKLYKFNYNSLSFVYNTFYYYDSIFKATASPSASSVDEVAASQFTFKKYLLNILMNNNARLSPGFTKLFLSYNNNNNINLLNSKEYFVELIKRTLYYQKDFSFCFFKSEFVNPACQTIYMTLCELMLLGAADDSSPPSLLPKQIGDKILYILFDNMNNSKDDEIIVVKKQHLNYWINSVGLILANLPEQYSQSIYEKLFVLISTHEIFTSATAKTNDILDYFDYELAVEKNYFNEITLLITVFHSIWCHSTASHFFHFVKFLKERLVDKIDNECKFLLICKLIGPFLSKIHIENTNLLLELVNILYDMILVVSTRSSSSDLVHVDTICNFFYHLKYRHIGESIKEKIFKIMPQLRVEFQKNLKYIASDIPK